ncbi:peptidylprolyl isomerase [Pseudooceanicola sp.]|uniref:peptidylprolyl isomerase n=1 Tax=Pseudooceanicola sp. TaxID=1914328 RepID=UPI0026364C59|nr:peptidylprolyl isomerase [Pseudooceanicola sp.]MDF1854160.1 peptidylprolyl isomerase [Pseudooceanicola sp.]
MTNFRLLPARLMPLLLAAAVTFATLSGDPARAQNPFSPIATVGDAIVTYYERDQRALMLQLLNAPGNPEETALEQLIDDRLKIEAARRFDISVDAEELSTGKADMASRANLTSEQFEQALQQAGVAPQTFEAFIVSGVVWRKLVRGRYTRFIDIKEQDIDRALTTSPNNDSVRILISEIFIPVTPENEADAQDLARQISQITSFEGFASAARDYSASPSSRAGGKVNWIPLNQMPPNLRPVIMALEPGQVTAPLPVPGAIALFQLRAMNETEQTPLKVKSVDYAAYYLAGGRSEETLAQAAKLKAEVDRCDDLYGIAKGQPESVLERGSKPLNEIPQDVAYELAKLDSNEVSTALTRSNGQTLVFLMLCKRETEIADGVDREAVRLQLQNREIERLAAGYLAQLRAETRIKLY